MLRSLQKVAEHRFLDHRSKVAQTNVRLHHKFMYTQLKFAHVPMKVYFTGLRSQTTSYQASSMATFVAANLLLTSCQKQHSARKKNLTT